MLKTITKKKEDQDLLNKLNEEQAPQENLSRPPLMHIRPQGVYVPVQAQNGQNGGQKTTYLPQLPIDNKNKPEFLRKESFDVRNSGEDSQMNSSMHSSVRSGGQPKPGRNSGGRPNPNDTSFQGYQSITMKGIVIFKCCIL